jgi:hypothetical protein
LERGIPARLSPQEGRKFAFPVGTAFLVLAGIVWWRGHIPVATVFVGLGAPLLLAGLIIPGKLGPVYRGWMKFALLLSKVTTPIFMGITYYLVMAPIGLFMRLIGYNAVVHKPVDDSFWVIRPDTKRKSDLERQF